MRRVQIALIIALSSYCSFSRHEKLAEWEILETERHFTIEDVKNLPSIAWKKAKLPVVPGFSQSTFWLRTNLNGLDPDTYYLINPVAYVEVVNFYYFYIDEIDKSYFAKSIDHQNRPKIQKFPYPLFQFSYDRQSEAWIYLQFTSDSSIYIEPLLFDAETLPYVYFDLQIFHFLFFTVLGFILLFNLSRYVQTQNNVFVFYAFYILVVMLYQIAYTGLGKTYFWNDYPEWNRRSLVVLGSLSFFAMNLFAIRFFQIQRKSIRIYRFLLSLLIIIGFNTILGLFIPIAIADPMTHIICFLTALILLSTCIYIFSMGLGFVRFYLAGISFLIMSIIGFNLFAFGILPWAFMRFSIEIGTFVEIFVFNLAIWDKVVQLERSSQFKDSDSEFVEMKSQLLTSLADHSEKAKTRDRIFGLDRVKVLQKIQQLMQEKIYCDEDLGLSRMANILDIRPDQLSALINQEYQMNFNQFINKHRVEYAKQLLLTQPELSILRIAFDSGFNSKSTFNTEFKKNTGKTPSEFRGQL